MEKRYYYIGLAVLAVILVPVLMADRSNPNPVTMEKYERIIINDSLAKVESIIGRPGILMVLSVEDAMEMKGVEGRLYKGLARKNWQVYGWKNTRGNATGSSKRIIVMFTEDRMVAKMQAGLD